MSDLLSLAECERMSTARVHEEYRRHVGRGQVSLMTSFTFGRELVAHAEGTTIHTTDGRRVLDFTGGVGVLNHGHNHPRILAARERYQRQERLEWHQNYFSPYVAALSHNLAQLLPGDLSVSFFPNSGAEAVEGAVKVAYRYHGGRRNRILHADISFHGKLLGSGSLTGASRNTFAFPGIPGVLTYTYDDIESVRSAVASARDESGESDVYAILVEPFSASTMRHCSESFLRELRELCDDEDIVLLFDEIYTGWGKTGSLFYFMRYPDLVPDLLTTSKSFGGGKSSISALVAREPVFRRACGSLTDALAHSATTAYHGFGEETVTALEAVRIVIDDDYPARAREIEQQLGGGLRRLAKRHPGVITDVHGTGALFGVFLDGGPKALDLVARLAPGGFRKDPNFRTKLITCAVVDALYRDHDVYSYYTLNGRNPLVAAPSLVATPEDIERFLHALDDTLSRGMTRLLVRFVRQKVGSMW
jgi:putrescine aminotransferase